MQRTSLRRGEWVQHELADCGNVTWGGLHDKLPACLGEGGIDVAAVGWIRAPRNPPVLLEARYHVR